MERAWADRQHQREQEEQEQDKGGEGESEAGDQTKKDIPRLPSPRHAHLPIGAASVLRPHPIDTGSGSSPEGVE